MIMYLGSDHAGYALKDRVKRYLTKHGIDFEDLGDTTPKAHDDYPTFGFRVAEKVQSSGGEGILSCQSAGGMTIVANKVRSVRAVECSTVEEVVHAKSHNNANVLVLSQMATGQSDVTPLLDAWFTTKFSNEERHVRRLQEITAYESDHYK